VSSRVATDGQLRAIEAMLFALSAPAAKALERAMRACLAVPEPPRHEQRQTSLGHLAGLVLADLEQRDPEDRRPPRVPRKDYDATRPPEAARSAVLVRKYGGWVEACAAARALAGKGRKAGDGKPWETSALGGRRGRNYERWEIIDAVIEVAGKLDRDPQELTSHAYYTWVAEMRRRAQKNGSPPPRWPTQRSVERFFSSWSAVRRVVRAEMRNRPLGTLSPRPSAGNKLRD